MNDKVEWAWKEAVVAYFKVCWRFVGRHRHHRVMFLYREFRNDNSESTWIRFSAVRYKIPVSPSRNEELMHSTALQYAKDYLLLIKTAHYTIVL
jgi:hypothetical protein